MRTYELALQMKLLGRGQREQEGSLQNGGTVDRDKAEEVKAIDKDCTPYRDF